MRQKSRLDFVCRSDDGAYGAFLGCYERDPSATTKTLSDQERQKAAHLQAIDKFSIRWNKDCEVSGIRATDRRVIDFQDRARFDKNIYWLNIQQAKLLRDFVPELLSLASSDLGKRILKRVVVEASPINPDVSLNLD